MKNTHIAEITVSAKKGHTQATRWLITQCRPFPDLHAASGVTWRNAQGLIPQYGMSDKTPTIGTEYRCQLLRSDYEASKATGNRNDFAGFDTMYTYVRGVRVPLPPLPGAIELRGKSLGEMCVTFGANPDYPETTVRGFGNQATPSEREWVNLEIVPALREYIAQNAASLKAQAVADLKADVAKSVAEFRAYLDAAEAKMNGLLAKL